MGSLEKEKMVLLRTYSTTYTITPPHNPVRVLDCATHAKECEPMGSQYNLPKAAYIFEQQLHVGE
jgi:hypothetical protein